MSTGAKNFYSNLKNFTDVRDACIENTDHHFIFCVVFEFLM